ncbi:MAG: TonB-dependent receptor [bacterium]|nr:TonB-dependent receptor [bacterium]
MTILLNLILLSSSFFLPPGKPHNNSKQYLPDSVSAEEIPDSISSYLPDSTKKNVPDSSLKRYLPDIKSLQPDSAEIAEKKEIAKRKGNIYTATKTEESAKYIGKCYSVITREEIERDGSPTVFDVLRNYMGVFVAQEGPLGGITDVHMRGLEGNHTLVLIDGVKVNNPASTDRGFDWGTLSTTAVEKIEIIRGPQGSIYGNDASGGVINIITKKGRRGFRANAKGYFGTYNTLEERAGMNGGTNNFDYAVSMFNINSGGLSKALALADSQPASETDGYKNKGIYTKINTYPFNNLSVNLTMGMRNSQVDIDAGQFMDSSNLVSLSNFKYGTLSLNHKLSNLYSYKLSSEVSNTNGNESIEKSRINMNDNYYEGEYTKTEFQNKFNFDKSFRVITGIEYAKETGENGTSRYGGDCNCSRDTSHSVSNRAVYAEVEPSYKNLFLNLSGRIDDYQRFGTQSAWLFSMAFLVKNTRFKGNYGYGFKTPTFYQLFNPVSGNPELIPEQTRGYDVGAEHRFKDGRAEITYFNQHVVRSIDIIENKYKNRTISNAWCTDGIEFYFLLMLFDDLSMDINFTGVDKVDWPEAYLLIPSLNYRWGINYRWFNVKFCCIGKRQDKDALGLVDIKSCRKIDVSYSFPSDVSKNGLKFQVRIENLINEQYMESWGYSVPGRGIYFGLSY